MSKSERHGGVEKKTPTDPQLKPMGAGENGRKRTVDYIP